MSRPGGAGPPSGPPLSFKTVPGRNRTQKWQQAKTYNYDGDDWGGYDPYDDYGDGDEPQTGPSYASPPPSSRANRATSFDRGDERRNFSAGPILYEEDVPHSAAVRPDPVRTRPRDFTNPDQVPAPLSTRGSPSPVRFPPRKSSAISDNAPNLTQQEPTQTSGRRSVDEKPLPFIRPSDIYKRIAEEREKEKTSMDSSRPSMDSIRKEVPSAANPTASASSDSLPSSTAGQRVNLQPLQEQNEPDTPHRTTFPTGTITPATHINETSSAQISAVPAGTSATKTSPVLPEVSGISTFSNDFWSGTPLSVAAAATTTSAAKQIATIPPSTGAAADLQHQPSVGLRSVVHTAFDRKPDESVPDTPVTRGDSESTATTGGVSRSDTNSTSGISPIMSTVPVSLAAQLQQQDGNQISAISEEPSSSSQRRPLPADSRATGKPFSAQDRSTSADIPFGVMGFQPGYRRSLDPPSKENSPARTPQVEVTGSKRLSRPMSATVDSDGQNDVGTAGLKSMSSGNSRLSDTIDEYTKALPVKSRGRSGTNLSLREADLAEAVSASPEDTSALPAAAHAQTVAREQFLREHENAGVGMPSTGNTDGAGASTASGRYSPTKGRVREIAEKYQDIHEATQRGSQANLGSRKSSWSNFRGSEEDLTLKQRPTGELDGSSDDKNMFPKYENSAAGASASNALDVPLQAGRTGAESQHSFRPQMPGGWQSAATTPATEQLPVISHGDPTASTASEKPEEIDLSPTSKKEQLVEGPSSNPGFALKSAGAALGASLLATAGLNSKAQDFASKETQPVEQPGMQLKPSVGAIQSQPPLFRGDSEITDAPTSAATSRPPTPPAKDETSHDTNTFAPLKYGQTRHEHVDGTNKASTSVAGGEASGITEIAKPMSSDAATADTESDRLHREIVRSLDGNPVAANDTLARVQGAVDAPTNQRLTEQARSAQPAAEMQSRPHLPQRFSWEDPIDDLKPTAPTQAALTLPTITEPAQLPEIMPEMPYERPRSKDLHIVNHEDGDKVVSPVSPIDEESASVNNTSSLSQAVNESTPEATSKAAPPIAAQHDDSTPSYQFAEFDTPELEAPQAVKNDSGPVAGGAVKTPTKVPESARQQRPISAGQRIPPTREILALKSASDRISAYNHTRRTYAEMDTGLSDWLGTLAVQYPDVASARGGPVADFTRPAVNTTSPSTFGGRHKHSPSLMNFTNQFRSGTGDGSPSGKRKASLSQGNAAPLGTADTAGGRPTPGRDAAGDGEGKRMNVDMDKMQQRGKDLIKNANILGGKAQAGAKGLFAKGKSKFGKREKVVHPPREPVQIAEQPPMRAATTTEGESLAGTSESDAPSFPTALQVSESRSLAPNPIQGPASHEHEYNTMPPPPLPNDPEPHIREPEDNGTMPLAAGMPRPLSLVAHSPMRPNAPPRAISQTPSSHSGSLSRAISRLSKTISRSSGSRSRPVSIAVANDQDIVLPTDSQPPVPQQTSIDIPTSSEAAHSLASTKRSSIVEPSAGTIKRREVWAEKGATLPIVPKDDHVAPERLGVLPSPGQSLFDRPVTGHGSSDGEKTPTQPKRFNLSVGSMPRQSIDSVARSPSALEEENPDITTPRAHHRDEQDAAQPATPTKVSDADLESKHSGLPLPGATTLGLAAAAETALDEQLEWESNASTVDHFEDARDTFGPESVMPGSRRTSMSSLADRTAPNHVEQIMTTQRISQDVEHEPLATPGVQPAVPLKEMLPAVENMEPLAPSVSPLESEFPIPPRQDEAIVKRPDMLQDRPLSFMDAPRDAQGVPVEQVNTAPQRMVNGTMYKSPRMMQEEVRNPRPLQSPAHPALRERSIPQVDRNQPVDNEIAQMNRPSRFHMSDQYGLEGLAVSGPDALKADEEDQSLPDSTDATPRRRSSGIWQKIRSRSRSRNRSASRPVSAVAMDTKNGYVQGGSTDDIPPVPPIPLAKAQPVRPVHATTMPATPEPQKKRRSMLASLFSRPNEDKSPQTPPISKKLTKKAQTGKRLSLQPSMPIAHDASVQGKVDYGTFEAMRRQQQTPPQNRPQMSRPGRSEEERRRRSMPVMGFTSPAGRPPLPFEQVGRGNPRRAPQPNVAPPSNVPPRPDMPQQPYRSPQQNIPPASRQTEAGYRRKLVPIGPPPERRVVNDVPPANRQPTLPTDHESWLRQGAQQPYNPQQHEQRMRSYGDQVPGQPRRPQAVPNNHCGAPIANIPRQRQRSEGQVTARSPAKEYQDQQTPWTINMPGVNNRMPPGNYVGSRQPSYNNDEPSYDADSGEIDPRHWPLPPQHQHYQYAHNHNDGNGDLRHAGGRRRQYSEEDQAPKMSATSYPGQEWVPQGLGTASFD